MITDVQIIHWLIRKGYKCVATSIYEKGNESVVVIGNIVSTNTLPHRSFRTINSITELQLFLAEGK